MTNLFYLEHIHEVGDDEDVKFIGVYSSRENAEAAVKRLSLQPGFRDSVDGFKIYNVNIDQDGWTEGFISWDEANNSKN